jgi:hypothetical protein
MSGGVAADERRSGGAMSDEPRHGPADDPTREPTDNPRREASDEELRAAYEAQVKQLRVDHVLLETAVTLINLGMRRTGLVPGTEDERDPGQVQVAIEAIRALMPVVEQAAPGQAAPLRDGLSQLQLAFVRIGGAGEAAPGEGGEAAPETKPTESKPDEPGPAQSSGRLWVPGQ